jgi:DNA repair protein RecN (Recombination protein N)
VAADLIDIHGQHDHQSLLHPARHVEFLDAWAGQEAATRRRQVLALHGELQRARQELGRAATGEREREQRLDLLRFQREEIDAAAPCPGEEETLRTERDRLANAERLCAGAAAALAALEDREPGAGDLLAAAAREAETMAALDAGVLPVAELLASALVAVREAVAELRLYVDSLEVSPERLEQVQERLETYRRLRRKYGDTVAEVLEYRARLEAELEALAGGEEQRARLTATCERLATLVDAEAGALHAVRSAAAARFEGEIARHLADLNMAGTRFAVRLEPPAPAGQGGGAVLGSAEFLLAANAGEPLRPLARIASGGELSRVMLALKTAMAGSHPVALIFDEVDAGVGGRTAQALGAKMAELSRANQVLCVTHLPQIACLAHRHLQVRKRTVAGRTLVEVAPLEGEARVGELARMLGGAEATAAQHARQLLAAAAS